MGQIPFGTEPDPQPRSPYERKSMKCLVDPVISLLSFSPPSLVPIMSRADDLPDTDLSRRTLDATRIHFELASQTSTTQQITVNETETQVIQEYKEKQNTPVTQDEASETIYVSYFILYQSHLDSKNLSLG